ncbi:hypothetical protein [Methylotetracoccus oryzae]|uniref:hypothetical protein n=1 Tax=Methylotetracoccus oryzae TaxID=1919059 RepID=UPI001118ABB7|nr:hypothetical protein [Methylotetracoccus oryzae]
MALDRWHEAESAAGAPRLHNDIRKAYRREKAVCALMLISLVWGTLSLLPMPSDEGQPSAISTGRR